MLIVNRYVSEYILDGHRYILGNIIIVVHRIFLYPNSIPNQDAPRPSLPPFDSLELLDPSGAYILQASVRLADDGKPEITAQASNALRQFQERMKGIVNLDVAERLSLDTRVKYRPR